MIQCRLRLLNSLQALSWPTNSDFDHMCSLIFIELPWVLLKSFNDGIIDLFLHHLNDR